uniref:Prolyl 4-hydroxylase subunit alpha-1-like n=1 Tax=Drosophila rhopaloa TaxID=1041015 RepID=A0A6P4ERE2_DRORH
MDKKLRLYCVYNSTASPFFRLAPLKVEILSVDPYIVIFHDIVSLKERKRIRKGSKHYLIPASTFNSTSSTYQIESTRTSTSVWLPSSTNDLTQKLTNVMEDATGLDLRHSEMFQGINNGVGGLFGGQFDTLPKNELSDVPQGGGIVFTALNLTVFPQPGSVLFWYNLDNMGNEDPKSHHIGCPVIVGSKWGKFTLI